MQRPPPRENIVGFARLEYFWPSEAFAKWVARSRRLPSWRRMGRLNRDICFRRQPLA